VPTVAIWASHDGTRNWRRAYTALSPVCESDGPKESEANKRAPSKQSNDQMKAIQVRPKAPAGKDPDRYYSLGLRCGGDAVRSGKGGVEAIAEANMVWARRAPLIWMALCA
jgi:hypothetical protein